MDYTAMAWAVDRGFVAAATDTGHTGGDSDLAFGYGHPEKIIDWGYRAVHLTAQVAKQVIRRYAGGPPSHAVFAGCSTGGHQALSEVQRFPEDYDGVIAGDPGNDRVHINVGFLWAYAATHDEAGNPLIPTSKLELVSEAAVNSCDALDGLKDGIISLPEACHFDPANLLCHGEEDGACLTVDQVAAVKKVYAGPRNPRTGEQIIAGYEPASESGWASYIVGPKEPKRLLFWKLWVFGDPNWNWRKFDYDRDVAYADRKLAAVNAVNPDLTAFRARGGKLIMYSGWADPVGPPLDAVNYYKRVESAVGDRQSTESFFRLFMIPGMGHCAGGSGPDNFGQIFGLPVSHDRQHDLLVALTQWLEQGTAPEYLIASQLTDARVVRSRPICPYPKVARWDGTHSPNEASSFTCTE